MIRIYLINVIAGGVMGWLIGTHFGKGVTTWEYWLAMGLMLVFIISNGIHD